MQPPVAAVSSPSCLFTKVTFVWKLDAGYASVMIAMMAMTKLVMMMMMRRIRMRKRRS